MAIRGGRPRAALGAGGDAAERGRERDDERHDEGEEQHLVHACTPSGRDDDAPVDVPDPHRSRAQPTSRPSPMSSRTFGARASPIGAARC